MREAFRAIKAQVQYHILNQKDNNGLYIVDGSLSKLESKLSEKSVHSAARNFKACGSSILRTAGCTTA